MAKKTIPAISFRPVEEARNNVLSMMEKCGLNQTDALNCMLVEHGGKANCNPYYRGILAQYAMDMESALNIASVNGDVTKARKVLEELLCQMSL